jgi:beta-glucosidase
MKGHTYRYFEGEPLYPFGYGLSYTTFLYSGLTVPETIVTTDTLKVKVDIRNTGKLSGDEVVQLYIKHLKTEVPVPVHSLQGFKRVHLNQDEQKSVQFLLTPSQLSVINDNNERIVQPGIIQLYVGGGQPSLKNTLPGNVLVQEIKITGNTYLVDRLDK